MHWFDLNQYNIFSKWILCEKEFQYSFLDYVQHFTPLTHTITRYKLYCIKNMQFFDFSAHHFFLFGEWKKKEKCKITIWTRCRFRRTLFKQTNVQLTECWPTKIFVIILQLTALVFVVFIFVSLPERIEYFFKKKSCCPNAIKTDYIYLYFLFHSVIWCDVIIHLWLTTIFKQFVVYKKNVNCFFKMHFIIHMFNVVRVYLW